MSSGIFKNLFNGNEFGNKTQPLKNAFGNLTPPQNNAFGNLPQPPPQNNAFGNLTPPQNNAFGNLPPPQNNAFGNLTPPQNNAFGNLPPPQNNAFGNLTPPPQNNAFGNLPQPPPQNNAFGNLTPPPQNNAFGNLTQPPPQNNAFGNLTQPPPQNNAFGNLTQPPPQPLEILSILCLPMPEDEINYYKTIFNLNNSNINRDIYKIIMNCNNPSNITNIQPNTLFINRIYNNYQEIAFIDRKDLVNLNPNDNWKFYDDNELFYFILKICKKNDNENDMTNFYITKAFAIYLNTKIKNWDILKVKDLSIDFLILCKEELLKYLIHRLRSSKLEISEINTITTSPFSDYLNSHINKNDISLFQINYQI